jgi:hypothetical protein
MGKIAKDTITTTFTMDGVFEGRYHEIDDYTIGFETYLADTDLAPLFRGLPGDRCQCRHWGVVLKGALIYLNADGTEAVIGPGEAYYVSPGHLPRLTAGTEVVEFSPTAELAETMAVVEGNLEAAAAGSQ